MQWPLVGRDHELGSVDELLCGSAGGVVLTGAAGVGKTRVAVEVSRIARSRGCAVEWVRATRSAASMPLGAFASLLPEGDGGAVGSAELLVRAGDALARRAAGRRLVLCVDDGHLLDHASAALLHQLVAAGAAFAVVTVRQGEPVADAVRALWKEELCLLLEIDVLSRAEVERLLEEVLCGPLDGRSASTLWELTRGNALFLRELVIYGVESGLLSELDGIWRWRGEVAVGTRLVELVGTRLEALGPAERRVLDVVAVGVPLEVGLLGREETAALEALELQALVERRLDGRRRIADVAHPLHGEVVRAQLPRTRLEAIQCCLADAVQARGARRRGDVLRVASWRLASGGVGDPALFQRAAEHALAALDWELAQRLALAAIQAGGGFGARLTLARALAGAGRATEAEELLGDLEHQASVDEQRVAVAIARARNLCWGLDRVRDADAALKRGERAIADAGLRDELVSLRCLMLCTEGLPLPALASAGPLLASPVAPEPARLRAAAAVGLALAMRGRTREAITVAETYLPAARRRRDELSLVELQLLAAQASALQIAGRLVEATEIAERKYEIVLRSRRATSVEAFGLGCVWLARGRVATALRWFRESATQLWESDPGGFHAAALAGIVQAAAQAGDADLARQAAEAMERKRSPGNRALGNDVALARAWNAAVAGELSRARTLALAAVDLAQSSGQEGFAVRALHELCRLGDPKTAAPRLAALVDHVDGPLAAIAAAHAAALVAGDGEALEAVARQLADLDALLVAAEAAQAAAACYSEAGREASARAIAARGAQWLDRCEGRDRSACPRPPRSPRSRRESARSRCSPPRG